MMFGQDDTRAPTHSQFALRVTFLVGFAVVAFVAIFFRLWFLQVLSGEAYLREANANRVREIKILAPRGEILDRRGHVLVDNRTVLSLQVRPDKLFRAPQERKRELSKLSEVAGMSLRKVKKDIREQIKLLPASPVTLQQNVDKDLVYFLRERQDEFPGITAEQVYVRNYPEGTLGAHLFGFVSEVGPEQLKEPAYDGLDPGDRIGASGLESQYDNVLRGRGGAVRVQVDASGEPRGRELSRVEPQAGDNLVLTLDEKVQRAGEAAISQFGLPAAFVAMKVSDGSILGMGSYPTYDPSIYTPPVSTKLLEGYQNNETAPLTDRAIQSGYPTGSTFKLVTATAGLEASLITPTTPVEDAGVFNYAGQEWINAGRAANGTVDMTSALRVSSDIYFYKLGIALEDAGKEALQTWASDFGFGSLTGVDLPSEGAGLVPSPEWRNKLYEDAADPGSCSGTQRDYLGCGETDRKWSVGDNMNLSVGQGDLSATPLQLAVAYAAMGNGGNIVRPHLADRAENALGQATQEIEPAAQRHIDISAEARSTILEGLREAAMEPGGTSYPVFGGFPIEIAGKTGTAEKTLQEDQSWYAALAPYDDPKYVVIVTVERGGFGAQTAAPAARAILSQLFDVGSSQIEDVGGALGAD
ncbi:MAG: penicillin-binding protein 2 [Solirubrobacterales bacterium]|nr:penicillin-binding protein 2 [Solirubrobacterales bacterium]